MRARCRCSSDPAATRRARVAHRCDRSRATARLRCARTPGPIPRRRCSRRPPGSAGSLALQVAVPVGSVMGPVDLAMAPVDSALVLVPVARGRRRRIRSTTAASIKRGCRANQQPRTHTAPTPAVHTRPLDCTRADATACDQCDGAMQQGACRIGVCPGGTPSPRPRRVRAVREAKNSPQWTVLRPRSPLHAHHLLQRVRWSSRAWDGRARVR
jgi:hypothetical protein